jgi:hypothetical protein
MRHQFFLSRFRTADGSRMSDRQLGMLLDALQLGAETTESPDEFRRALALLAPADATEPLIHVA